MKVNTKLFGEIDVSEDMVIDFPFGVPAFDNVKKFVIVDSEMPDSPFKWMQSVDCPDLAFAIVDPFQIRENYDVDIDDNKLSEIGVKGPEDVALFSIVVLPEDTTKITMNLKAPVVINARERKGMQVILDTDKYTVRHYIMEELKSWGDKVDVNTCEEKGAVNCNK